MKVKVIKRDVDKHTKEMMEVNTVKDYPDERAEELIKHRYAVRAAEELPVSEVQNMLADLDGVI